MKFISSKKNYLGTVLFIGRKDCFYSKKISKLLKKISKKFFYFESCKIGEKIDKKYLNLNYDYIFCFRSFYVLKKNILKKVYKAAINFHPGLPEYRGIGCINFALYENSKTYGCMAHLINDKIDNGKIIELRKFNIKKKDNLTKVLKKTHKTMFKLAIFVIKEINKNSNYLENQLSKYKNTKWSNKLYKTEDLNNLYKINPNSTKKNFLLQIRATGSSKFKPYIELFDKKFFLDD